MQASVLVPVSAGKILFEVRALNISQAGEVCFPGGKIEDGEPPLKAAFRETYEELNLDQSCFTFKKALPKLTLKGQSTLQSYLVELRPDFEKKLRLSKNEVAQVFEVELSWFKNHKAQVYPLDDVNKVPPDLAAFLRNYPPLSGQTLYWQKGPFVIWGLTAQILKNALEEVD